MALSTSVSVLIFVVLALFQPKIARKTTEIQTMEETQVKNNATT